jgi:hypothetical protein
MMMMNANAIFLRGCVTFSPSELKNLNNILQFRLSSPQVFGRNIWQLFKSILAILAALPA